MEPRTDRRAGRAWIPALLATALLVALPALALDPPASMVNPKTGEIEIADPILAGTNQDVRYVINDGSRTPTIETVSDDAADDRAPRLSIGASGDAWVAWWRDLATDRVYVRSRDYDTGSWGDALLVGETDESSRNPDIVFDGTKAWVAYEFDDAGGDTAIAATIIDDDPDPVGIRIVLDTTPNPYEIDVQVHLSGGSVWVTWVQDNSDVGWSQYDTATSSWSLAAYESYVNDSIEDARDRIETTVTGN